MGKRFNSEGKKKWWGMNQGFNIVASAFCFVLESLILFFHCSLSAIPGPFLHAFPLLIPSPVLASQPFPLVSCFNLEVELVCHGENGLLSFLAESIRVTLSVEGPAVCGHPLIFTGFFIF